MRIFTFTYLPSFIFFPSPIISNLDFQHYSSLVAQYKSLLSISFCFSSGHLSVFFVSMEHIYFYLLATSHKLGRSEQASITEIYNYLSEDRNRVDGVSVAVL